MSIQDKGYKETSTFKNEYSIRTAFGRLVLNKNPEISHHRIRVIVTRKTGPAVRRNYYKRVIRESIRKNYFKIKHFNEIKFFFSFNGVAKYTDIMDEISRKTDLLS
jgi:ribonuclease P protein component